MKIIRSVIEAFSRSTFSAKIVDTVCELAASVQSLNGALTEVVRAVRAHDELLQELYENQRAMMDVLAEHVVDSKVDLPIVPGKSSKAN